MTKFALIALLLINPLTWAETYQPPKVRLDQFIKKERKNYKIQKDADYHKLKEHQYKIDGTPIRLRDLASEKNGGRLPSSKTIDYHKYKVRHWKLNPNSFLE